MSFQKEEELYPIIRVYFERNGYHPVVQTPKISIMIGDISFKPDITARKGVKLVAVEAKLSVDESSITQSIVQASFYQRGCTHVYVAYPEDEFTKAGEEFRKTLIEECKKNKMGVLLVKKENVDEILEAVYSDKINFALAQQVIVDLERVGLRFDHWHAHPSLVKDACIELSKRERIERGAFEVLMKDIKEVNWLKEASATTTVENRIWCSIEVAKDMGLIEEADGLLKLSNVGRCLLRYVVKLADLGKPLTSVSKAFFISLLLGIKPFLKMIETLEAEKEMLSDWSICNNCGFKSATFKKFGESLAEFRCPKCGSSNINKSLSHVIQDETGDYFAYFATLFALRLGLIKKTKTEKRIRYVGLLQ